MPKNFVQEPFRVSLISGTEKVCEDKLGGGIKIFRREFFVSHCRKFPLGRILQCFLNFGYRKRSDKKGEYQDFSSKTICLTAPKNFVGEFFCVSLISGTEKVCEQEPEGVSRFSVESFCLTVPKNFVGDHFSVSLVSGTKKFLIKVGGEYRNCPSKVFFLRVSKVSVGGNRLVFPYFRVPKTFG